MFTTVRNKDLVVSKEFYVLGTTNILKAFGEKSETAMYDAMKKPNHQTYNGLMGYRKK